MELNRAQSSFEDLHIDSLPKEVKEEFYEILETVPFIHNMVSADRPECSDLPRDENNRAIIDICNPPLLKDMDYFTKSGQHFTETGKFCDYRPSKDENSGFYNWYKTEYERIREGMLRPTDGMWMPGDMYWYLNYNPMMKTVRRAGLNIGDKLLLLPNIWDGVFLRAQYQYQARYGGLYDPLGGHHSVELASRGKSKSYWAAAELSKIFIAGNNDIEKENVRAVIAAYRKEYLIKDGTLNKFTTDCNFISKHTEFPSHKLKSSLQDMDWIMGYHDMREDLDKGTLNEVLGVSTDENIDKLRGKRSAKILLEEAGTFPKLKVMYGVLLPSVQDGNVATGQLQIFGTAGDKASDFEAMKEFMYHPLGYNVYALPNVYDKNPSGKFAFFFGNYLNREGCYDKDGNSDITKALVEILMNRYRTKQETDDPNVIMKIIAEEPITPKEAVMRTADAFFPRQQLINRLEDLRSDPHSLDNVLVGILKMGADGKISFVPTFDEPIRKYPLNGNKYRGACEFFQMPEYDSSGKVFSDRYIAGLDPVDNDVSNSQSLASIFILDSWTDKIVFEYTGRGDLAVEYYEICRLSLLFYNARGNYENNIKGLYGHFEKMNCLYLLTDTLDFLRDKQNVNVSSTNNVTKGTRATTPVNSYADRLTRSWLLAPEVISIKDENNNMVETTVNHISTLQNMAFIQELIAFTPAINVDRVRAFGMLMLLREDRIIVNGGNMKGQSTPDKDYLGNDPFFERNYGIPVGLSKFVSDNKLSDNTVDSE